MVVVSRRPCRRLGEEEKKDDDDDDVDDDAVVRLREEASRVRRARE